MKPGPKSKYTDEERKERRRASARLSWRRRYSADPSNLKKLSKECAIKYKYGITSAFVEEERIKQHGCCKICKEENKKLIIDHDHSTGKYRGLICYRCNSCLGLAHDDIELLFKYIEYLGEN